jgi:4Fe-4S ferredoxin
MEATECKEAGVLVPLIDRNKCEGKADCVEVCPYDVFVVRKLEPEGRKRLSLIGKLKGFAHGWNQAFVERPADCHACGKCVEACPEKAIKLGRPT